MKNMNIKWISFITVLLIAFTVLAPMAFAEAVPEDMAPDKIIEDVTDVGGVDQTEDITTTGDDKDDAPKMIFEPFHFVENLKYMGLGMLGIFVVIGVIIIATALLNKLFKDKKES